MICLSKLKALNKVLLDFFLFSNAERTQQQLLTAYSV